MDHRGPMSGRPLPTLERLRQVLNYDPATGVFTWRSDAGPLTGKYRPQAGSVETFHAGAKYVRIKIGGSRYLAHRLAWLYVYGEEPNGVIDHINGDGTDNRISNLRRATVCQNLQNVKTPITNKSGVKGVYFWSAGEKWRAQIRAFGKTHYLGQFDDFESAVNARKTAELRFHGDFRRAA